MSVVEAGKWGKSEMRMEAMAFFEVEKLSWPPPRKRNPTAMETAMEVAYDMRPLLVLSLEWRPRSNLNVSRSPLPAITRARARAMTHTHCSRVGLLARL